MTHDEVLATIREYLDKVAPGCPMPRVTYSRAYSYAGRAIDGFGFREIKLSLAWKASTPEGQKQTLIHEAMHIADAHLNGHFTGHGWFWKSLMEKVGANPTRCSNDVGAVAAANQMTWHRSTWIFCPCRSHKVSPQMRASIARRPGSKICAKCRETLTLTPFPIEDTIRKCALDLAS